MAECSCMASTGAIPAGIHPHALLCPACRELLELGRWVAAKRDEYGVNNRTTTIEDWQMDILNWLDGFKAKEKKT